MQLDALKMRQIFTPSNEAQRVLRAATLRLMNNRLTGPIARRLFPDNKAKIADIVAQ